MEKEKLTSLPLTYCTVGGFVAFSFSSSPLSCSLMMKKFLDSLALYLCRASHIFIWMGEHWVRSMGEMGILATLIS